MSSSNFVFLVPASRCCYCENQTKVGFVGDVDQQAGVQYRGVERHAGMGFRTSSQGTQTCDVGAWYA